MLRAEAARKSTDAIVPPGDIITVDVEWYAA